MSATGVNFLIKERDDFDDLFRKAKIGKIDKSKVFKNNNNEFDSFSTSSNITAALSSDSNVSVSPWPVQKVVYEKNTQLYKLFECKLCKVNVIDTVFDCGHCACSLCSYKLSAICDKGTAFCHICNIKIKKPRRIKNDDNIYESQK